MVENMARSSADQSYAFGPFRLVPERQLLLRDGQPVRIGGRALDILTVLVEQAGETIEKRELIARVWPNVFVEESNLKVNMNALRRALGEGTQTPQYVATVVGRGYRFVAPVRSLYLADWATAPANPVFAKHNLPTAATRIVGRQAAIDAIVVELREARLVSIVGPGGVGKSTVAIAVAEQHLGVPRDGVWFVDLSILRDPGLIANAIAAAVGMEANAADMLAALCGYLRHRQMLVLLESCEHVIEAAAIVVERILAETTAVSVLTTSREPLQVKGERVRRLAGLETPPETAQLSAADALTFPALQLFVERATDRKDSFSLMDAEAPAAAAICRRLDGIPLAIELAATRVDAFGVSGLLSQLDDRLSLLTGWRAGPERHRTLAATLDWSYKLLAAPEASLLCALSVFAGQFNVADALAVGGGRPAETLDALAQLAAKSLLAVESTSDAVAYRLLDTTRAYAMERLEFNGRHDAVRHTHAEYICELLERAAAEWAERAAGEWGTAYGRTLNDLRGALDWASSDPQRQAVRIRLTVAGLLLWNHFSLTQESRVHVSRAVADLAAAGMAGSAAEMQLLMSLAGSTMFTRGLMPEALQGLQRAHEIAVRLGDTDHRLRCLRMIADFQLFTGAHNAGLATLDDFAALAAASDPSAMPGADTHIGLGEIYVGRLDAAKARLERLYERDLGDLDDSRFARFQYSRNVDVGNGLANAQWLTGFPDTALRTATSTIEQALRTRHELSVGNALAVTACRVAFMCGRYDDAARYTAQLEELVSRNSIAIWRPMALFFRGAIACATDHIEDGIPDLRLALDAFSAINHRARMPYHLAILAEALGHAGQIEEATSSISMARECAIAQNEGWCLPEVLRIEASTLAAGGQLERAKASLAAAMAAATDTGALSWQLRITTERARLLAGSHEAIQSRHALQGIYARFDEGHQTRDLVVAANLLAEPA